MKMRYLHRFNEDHQVSDHISDYDKEFIRLKKIRKENSIDIERAKTITDSLFDEIDERFILIGRFFPLKLKLNKHYYISICMSYGWFERMDDNDMDWMSDRMEFYKQTYGISSSMCADSFSSDIIYEIENNMFPKNTDDIINFPPNPFPEEEEDEEEEGQVDE